MLLSGCRPTGDVAFADRSGGSAAGAGTVHDEEGWCELMLMVSPKSWHGKEGNVYMLH
jgi:hypothetical protein